MTDSSNTIRTTRRIAMFGASAGCSLEALKLLVGRPDDAESIELLVFCRSEQKVKDALNAAQLSLATGSTQVTFFTGDAMNANSVNNFFRTITNAGPLTDVTSSLGGYPVFNKWNPFAPVKLAPGMEHICQETMQHIVHALQTIVAPRQPDGKAPALFVVSSNGIGKATHDELPFILKHTVYGAWLQHPHADKEKMETFLHKQYGIQSLDFHPAAVAPHEALSSHRLTIIRPSLLLDGAAKNRIRASSSTLKSAWSISRKDVGAFLTGDCLRLTKTIANEPVLPGHAYVVSY